MTAVTVVVVETVATSKVAATGAACVTGSAYSIGSGGNIYQIDTTSAVRTRLGTLPANPAYNAMGITRDGSRVYAAISAGSGASTIDEFDPATQTSHAYAGPTVVGSYSFVMGAVDPTSGIFYLGTYAGSGVDIYGFDTATNQPIAGRVAQLQGLTGSGGDMVFDATGHLYVVSGSPNRLVRVDQAVPTGGADAALTSTLLTTLTGIASPNGVTFDGDGYLYVSTASELAKLNPDTGALVSSVAIPAAAGGDNTVDLADCQYNGVLQVQTNVTRYGGGADQFALSITGGGVTSGNTAVTSGQLSGQQNGAAATAGPIAALGATTYLIHESPVAPALASNYAVSASCVDTADGNAPVPITPVVPGATGDYSLMFPDATGSNAVVVACTFTLVATPAPVLSLTKVLAAPRLSNTDQFSVAIHTASAAGPVVSSAAHATTTGTGASIGAGTGTTGPFTASAGTTYYLTEVGAGSTDLTGYLATVSCTDSAHLQSGLPTAAPFTGSLAITPVNGAQIACVLSNGVQGYRVSEVADATVLHPGDVIAYSVTITNSGSYSYPAGVGGAGAVVDLSGQLDDGSVVSGSVTATAGTAAVAAGALNWSGPLPATGVGSSVTVGYQVKVAASGSGDEVVTNSLTATAPGGSCATGGGCAISTPVQSYVAVLTADSSVVTAGGAVGYTVTVTNSGRVAYAGAAASISVDLSGIGDDAAYVPNSVSASAGTLQLSNTFLRWSGPLPISPAAGAVVTLHFRMRVPVTGAAGDGALVGVLAVAGPGGRCAGGCTTTVGVEQFSVSVASDATSVGPGAVVTYRATVTNTGRVAYSGATPASSAGISDDLSDLLDDGALVPSSIQATAGSIALDGATLVWTGPLAVAPRQGAIVTITFSLRLDIEPAGNHELHNHVTTIGPGAVDPADADGGAPVAFTAFTVSTQITATGVGRGGVAALAFTVTNTGGVDYTAAQPAAFSVTLAGALSGARIDTNGTPGASAGPNQLGWSGPVPVGASETVTFTLVLGPGDGTTALLASVVTPAGSGGGCGAVPAAVVCPTPTMFVSGAVAAEMIESAGLAFTGSPLRTELAYAAVALLAGLELQLLALVYAGRGRSDRTRRIRRRIR